MLNRVILCILVSSIMVIAGYVIAIFLLCDPITNNEVYCGEISKFATFYADNIRGHIFAGFLALGGFLLSLKTFIIVNMKDNVYDNSKYQETWEVKKKLNPKSSLYAPLKELSDILYYAILASIISAATQMTIGLYKQWYAAIFSVFTCVVASVLLLESLRLIKSNLDTWFSYIENDNQPNK